MSHLVCSFEFWSQKRVARTVAAARVIASELAEAVVAAATGALDAILKCGAELIATAYGYAAYQSLG